MSVSSHAHALQEAETNTHFHSHDHFEPAKQAQPSEKAHNFSTDQAPDEPVLHSHFQADGANSLHSKLLSSALTMQILNPLFKCQIGPQPCPKALLRPPRTIL